MTRANETQSDVRSQSSDPLARQLKREARATHPSFRVDLHRRIMAQLDAQPTVGAGSDRGRYWLKLAVPATGLAAAACLALVVWINWGQVAQDTPEIVEHREAAVEHEQAIELVPPVQELLTPSTEIEHMPPNAWQMLTQLDPQLADIDDDARRFANYLASQLPIDLLAAR